MHSYRRYPSSPLVALELSEFSADLVVIGVGILPNIELAEEAEKLISTQRDLWMNLFP